MIYRKFLYSILITDIFLSIYISVQSSEILKEGLSVIAPDSSFALKLELRLQPRLEIYTSLEDCECEEPKNTVNAMLRRMRVRFEGFVGTPSLTYFFQLGLTNKDMASTKGPDGESSGLIYDAYIDWEFVNKTKLRVGQAKLPGAMSRLMSYGGLNFLERSNAESMFNSYRDIGLQLHNEWSIGNVAIREQIAITQGEGVNQPTYPDDGFAYSARLELMPFGDFTNSGLTYEMDLANEKTPKLMIGGAAFFDDNAQRERAVLGNGLIEAADITSYFADFLFKYSGFAAQGEYYKRQTPVPVAENNGNSSHVYAGEGYSAQASYMLSEDMSLGLRYSYVAPNKEISNIYGKRTDYSLGFTKFIFGNKVKLQTDLTYYIENIFQQEPQKKFMYRINAFISI